MPAVFVRLNSLPALKAALQKTLGRAQPQCAPEPDMGWVRAPADGALQLLVEDSNVVLGLDDGRLYVGRVTQRNALYVRLALWGCGGRVQRFPIASVVGASIVGPHSFTAAREVKRRQRRDEPALVRTKASA